MTILTPISTTIPDAINVNVNMKGSTRHNRVMHSVFTVEKTLDLSGSGGKMSYETSKAVKFEFYVIDTTHLEPDRINVVAGPFTTSDVAYEALKYFLDAAGGRVEVFRKCTTWEKW